MVATPERYRTDVTVKGIGPDSTGMNFDVRRLFQIAHAARLRAESEGESGDVAVAVVFAAAAVDAFFQQLVVVAKLTQMADHKDNELKDKWPEGDRLSSSTERFLQLMETKVTRRFVLNALTCVSNAFRNSRLNEGSHLYKNAKALVQLRNWNLHYPPEFVVGTHLEFDDETEVLAVEHGESSLEWLFQDLRNADAFPKYSTSGSSPYPAALKTLASFDVFHVSVARWACETAARIGKWTLSIIPEDKGPLGLRIRGLQFWRAYRDDDAHPQAVEGVYDGDADVDM